MYQVLCWTKQIIVLDIYKKSYAGEAIIFDLTNGLTKFVRTNNKDHAVSNVTQFTRTTTYIRNPEYKIVINQSCITFCLYIQWMRKRKL